MSNETEKHKTPTEGPYKAPEWTQPKIGELTPDEELRRKKTEEAAAKKVKK